MPYGSFKGRSNEKYVVRRVWFKNRPVPGFNVKNNNRTKARTRTLHAINPLSIFPREVLGFQNVAVLARDALNVSYEFSLKKVGRYAVGYIGVN